MIEFDPGPTKALARHLDDMPSYAEKRELFWYDWGPIFYRGRLNGSARLLGIASDPGPTERIAGRTLVGDAGQRVQGFLSKLGLTRSYVLVNAYAYALHPSRAPRRPPAAVRDDDHRRWRNKLYDMVSGSDLEAIVAFGGEAQAALDLWDATARRAGVRAAAPEQPQPGHAGEQVARGHRRPAGDRHPRLRRRSAAAQLRQQVPREDYARIPLRDLPFGVPEWFGDDAWGRTARRRHNNSVSRPGSDLEHTLVWQAPPGQR